MEESLRTAVHVARAGERGRARELFRAILIENPRSLEAWLWMSEVAETLEEQVSALEQAMCLCPPDSNGIRSLQTRLSELRGAVPLPETNTPKAENPQVNTSSPSPEYSPDPMYLRAEHLALTGHRDEAARIITEWLAIHPQDEASLLLLCEMQQDVNEKARLIQKVLDINPYNADAAHRLETLRPILDSPLQHGLAMEQAGEYEQALKLYETVIVHAPLPAERIEASRRIDSIHLRRAAAQAVPVHPTLNLLRVTAGPVLLFALMVFIQSGLNPLHVSLLAYPGLVSVLVGSLLVSITNMRPIHPKWIELFGHPGTGDEPQTRRDLGILGWALMLAPFTIFLVEASYRLGELQASMMANP